MFPFLIDSNPINGSKDIPLDTISTETPIILTFKITDTEYIDATLADAKIELFDYSNDVKDTSKEVVSLFNGTPVDLKTIELDKDKKPIVKKCDSIAIYPSQKLNGLTEYRVFVSNLKSNTGEIMSGSLELRFTTEPDTITDYIESPTIEGTITGLQVIKTYPRDGSVVTPDFIKIQFDDPINDGQFTSTNTLLIEGTDIEEALFIGINNLINDDLINIDTVNNTLSIIGLSDFSPAKEYTFAIFDESHCLIHSISFTTEVDFSPMYTDVTIIKRSPALEVVLRGTSDADIKALIHDNSKLAEFIAEQFNNKENIDWDTPALFVSKYVQYKTQYDIIFDKLIQISANATSKQLKDLSIEYGFSLNDMLALVDKLKDEYSYWEAFLKGSKGRGFAGAAVFRKGENVDEDPEFMSRKHKDREGVKEW